MNREIWNAVRDGSASDLTSILVHAQGLVPLYLGEHYRHTTLLC